MKNEKQCSYEDIIHLPHHVSQRHPQMPVRDRAAQFAPFAALTGYEAEVKEAGRLTDRKTELSEEQKYLLDMQLRFLLEDACRHPEVTITYYLPDGRKEGGAYVTATGTIKKIDEAGRTILLQDGREIPVGDILDIQCGEGIITDNMHEYGET